MRIHGVDADYIAGLRKAGYDGLTVEDLIKTRIHGATPAYVAEFRNAGYTGLTIEDLVRTRIHGATPRSCRRSRPPASSGCPWTTS